MSAYTPTKYVLDLSRSTTVGVVILHLLAHFPARHRAIVVFT